MGTKEPTNTEILAAITKASQVQSAAINNLRAEQVASIASLKAELQAALVEFRAKHAETEAKIKTIKETGNWLPLKIKIPLIMRKNFCNHILYKSANFFIKYTQFFQR
jgi:hypothetical protein